MSPSLSFYLAGTMQGSNPGIATVDQGYRIRLEQIIVDAYPAARVLCPYRILTERLGPHRAEIAQPYVALQTEQKIQAAGYEPGVRQVAEAFHDLVHMAENADVVVAYLPDHQASMGTAIEMWAAHIQGKLVVAITSMTQNLAVISTASVIVPTMESFAELLQSEDLESRKAKKGPTAGDQSEG
jgi:hypothetical protein